MNGVCIIVGAGEFYESNIDYNDDDFIIAADGGALSLKKINIAPDIVIGDFDSAPLEQSRENCVVLPKEKDITDTFAAINIGLEKGYKRFKIYGGTGGREEHTIANIQNIVNLSKMGCFAEIIDKERIITAITNEKIIFNKENRGYISVFSHSDLSTGVYEKGLKYQLSNKTLTNSEPLGISNEFIGESAEISVENGTIIIIYDRQSI